MNNKYTAVLFIYMKKLFVIKEHPIRVNAHSGIRKDTEYLGVDLGVCFEVFSEFFS